MSDLIEFDNLIIMSVYLDHQSCLLIRTRTDAIHPSWAMVINKKKRKKKKNEERKKMELNIGKKGCANGYISSE